MNSLQKHPLILKQAQVAKTKLGMDEEKVLYFVYLVEDEEMMMKSLTWDDLLSYQAIAEYQTTDANSIFPTIRRRPLLRLDPV